MVVRAAWPQLRAAATDDAQPRVAHVHARAAGYATLNDTSIRVAVRACLAESGRNDAVATFDCPKADKIYGKMQDWDTSDVTSFYMRAQLSRSPLWRGQLQRALPGSQGRRGARQVPAYHIWCHSLRTCGTL